FARVEERFRAGDAVARAAEAAGVRVVRRAVLLQGLEQRKELDEPRLGQARFVSAIRLAAAPTGSVVWHPADTVLLDPHERRASRATEVPRTLPSQREASARTIRE